MSRSMSVFAWLGTITACDVWIASTEARLPPRVITKWSNGVPTNWMSRDEWVVSALVVTTAAGLVVGVGILLALRYAPRLVHPAFSALAPAQREQVASSLSAVGLAMAAWCSIWMTWFHALVLRANTSTPPRLGGGAITVWVVAHLVVVLLVVLFGLRPLLALRASNARLFPTR